MNNWQTIETAPKDGTHILVRMGAEQGSVFEAWWESNPYTSEGEWCVAWAWTHGCGCCGRDDNEPTHWMPLPTPPEEVTEG